MNALRYLVVVALTAACAGALFGGCEKGPAQRTGEKIDRAIDKDPLIGKGPAEKAGRNVDKATGR